MEISGFNPVPYRAYSPIPKGESLEVKKVRLLGQRIKEIEQATQFIKENGYKPDHAGESYFLKKLNTL